MSLALPAKQRVLKVGISQTSYEEVVALCRQWTAEHRANPSAASSHIVCVTSVHGVILAEDDEEFAQILNGASIATPDGMPLVWALRSFGARRQQRVYGPTLMLHVCEAAARTGARVFLYGARPVTLERLAKRLLDRFPVLQIAGSFSPPFRPLTSAEETEITAAIRDASPDIIFVGISTPKQERWMSAHRDTFSGVTLIGVGAAFDFHAGQLRQAPAWMQRLGLEWLFRLLAEPARLWRRYLLVTPRFLPLWARQLWRQ